MSYAGLPTSPWKAAAKKHAPKGAGAVFTFELNGGSVAGRKFVEGLKLFSHVANIGDVRSLVIHPASTTYSQLNPEEQIKAGITPGMVRVSIGLENIEDINKDVKLDFAAVTR